MHARLEARRKAVQQNRQPRLNELRASIRQQVCHLRQAITPPQASSMTTDLLAFTRTLDGIEHIVATFDQERDDLAATLVPITSALDRMLASLTRLRTSIALLRMQQGRSPSGPVVLTGVKVRRPAVGADGAAGSHRDPASLYLPWIDWT